ncbi:MAG: hypothetical protein JWL59_4824 [Chthoniobacteraceae bacterium]|nr:hypothetical protein [Chthoniobacteraceae bacterium]
MGLSRRFLFNDASWHGQCASADDFRHCIRFCMEVHSLLNDFGAGLEVGYNFRRALVGFVPTVQEALKSLSPQQRQRLLVWLDKQGPFWDRPARHSDQEYFECEGKPVTETALAEAAHLSREGDHPVMVSLPNSSYTPTKLTVTWHQGPYGTISFLLDNAVTLEEVASFAKACESTLDSYETLIHWAQSHCGQLAIIRKDILGQLGSTFIPAIAKRGKELLAALNAIVEALSKNDIERYNKLCSEWLTSDRFSDASQSEKNDSEFNLRMRFCHPCSGEYLWCYWHGKIRTNVFRLHFEWPPPFESRRMFIAYFGPKLTKK